MRNRMVLLTHMTTWTTILVESSKTSLIRFPFGVIKCVVFDLVWVEILKSNSRAHLHNRVSTAEAVLPVQDFVWRWRAWMKI